MASLNNSRCPKCFRKLLTNWSTDPILTKNGAKFVYDENSGLLIPEKDLDKRRYKGFYQVNAFTIKQLQSVRERQEEDVGISKAKRTKFSEIKSDGHGHWIITKQHIKELRESTEKILSAVGQTKEEYFNCDEDGTQRQFPPQLDWVDPELTKKNWMGTIKDQHIEDLRKFIRINRFEQYYWGEGFLFTPGAGSPGVSGISEEIALPSRENLPYHTHKWGFATGASGSWTPVSYDTYEENYTCLRYIHRAGSSVSLVSWGHMEALHKVFKHYGGHFFLAGGALACLIIPDYMAHGDDKRLTKKSKIRIVFSGYASNVVSSVPVKRYHEEVTIAFVVANKLNKKNYAILYHPPDSYLSYNQYGGWPDNTNSDIWRCEYVDKSGIRYVIHYWRHKMIPGSGDYISNLYEDLQRAYPAVDFSKNCELVCVAMLLSVELISDFEPGERIFEPGEIVTMTTQQFLTVQKLIFSATGYVNI